MKPLESIEIPDQSTKNNNCSEDTISNETKTKLLTNLIFLSMCLCYFVANLGMNTPYVYLSNMAELRGITKEKSDYLLSIIGKYMRITKKVKNTFETQTTLANLIPNIKLCIITSYNGFR